MRKVKFHTYYLPYNFHECAKIPYESPCYYIYIHIYNHFTYTSYYHITYITYIEFHPIIQLLVAPKMPMSNIYFAQEHLPSHTG